MCRHAYFRDASGSYPTLADRSACTHLVEMLTNYMEGALPMSDAVRLERHLLSCPRCTEYFAQMRSLVGSLGRLSEASVPAEMRERLMAAFADEFDDRR